MWISLSTSPREIGSRVLTHEHWAPVAYKAFASLSHRTQMFHCDDDPLTTRGGSLLLFLDFWSLGDGIPSHAKAALTFA